MLGAVLIGALGSLLSGHAVKAQTAWLSAGGDLSNSRGATSPKAVTQLSPSKIANLKLKWSLKTDGDISATPTVDATGLYVPDWAGSLYKVNAASGAIIWKHALADYNGGSPLISRTSPAIGALGEIIIGTMRGQLLSIDKQTGRLNWIRTLDGAQFLVITGSPVVYGSRIFVGLSSAQEAHIPAQTKGTFRGKVMALREDTGATIWSFTTVPAGYAGGAITGGITIDPVRNSAYAATGNNYTVPSSVWKCVSNAGSSIVNQRKCLDPTDYINAVVALDLNTGALKWKHLFGVVDIWNSSCSPPRNTASCPDPIGPDADFLSGPNLIKPPGFAGALKDDYGNISGDSLLGAGQKSGIYWGLNPATGGVFWQTVAGLGPIAWGSAVDLRSNNIIVVAAANRKNATQSLLGRNGQRVTTNAGSHAGIEASTGKLLWQVPAYGHDLTNPQVGATTNGSVTTTNFLAFAGSSSGYFEALSTGGGLVDWTYNSGAPVVGSPALYNDTVFWGTGYRQTGANTPRLFAFDLH